RSTRVFRPHRCNCAGHRRARATRGIDSTSSLASSLDVYDVNMKIYTVNILGCLFLLAGCAGDIDPELAAAGRASDGLAAPSWLACHAEPKPGSVDVTCRTSPASPPLHI